MALDSFVIKKRDEIRAFMADPKLRMLRIALYSESETLLMKILQSIEAEETEPMDLFIGFDHEFTDANSFYSVAAEKIQQNVREAEPELGKNGLQLKLPAGMYGKIDEPIEIRFTSYITDLSNALKEYVAHFILCFAPKEVKQESDMSSSLNAILELIKSPMIKIIFTDDKAHPILAHLRELRKDVADMEFSFEIGDIETELKEKLPKEDLEPEERIRILNMLAGFALARAELEISIDLFYQALEEAGKIGNPQEEAMALFNLGNAFCRKQDYENARTLYVGSLDISLDNEIRGLVYQNLINVGNTYIMEKVPDKALPYYETARVFSRSIANRLGECQALDGKGQANNMKGDKSEAEKNWTESLTIYRVMDPSIHEMAKYGEAQTLERLAELFEATGRKAQAKEYRNEAQKLVPTESYGNQESGDKK